MSLRAKFLRPIQPAFATEVSDDIVWSEVPDTDWTVQEGSDGNGAFFAMSPVSPYVGNNNQPPTLMRGWSAYGMNWHSIPLSASNTVVSATLEVSTTGNWLGTRSAIKAYLAPHDERNPNDPADASEAVSYVDRCGSKWSGAPDIFDGEGIGPFAQTVSLDVKDEIEGFLAISGWTADDGASFLLAGQVGGSPPVDPPGFPHSCTGLNADMLAALIEALTGSAGLPNSESVPRLTIVYN